jgi:ribonuclease P protein component
MGFAVPKKRVSRAVDRNRIKRLMREVYRMNRSTLHAGAEKAGRDLRIVLVFQHSDNTLLHEISFQSVEHAWNQVVAKILSMME